MVMPTLRNEQGKNLMDFLNEQALGRPIVCTGDFNADPCEPVYQTMTSSKTMRFVVHTEIEFLKIEFKKFQNEFGL